ncbi:MbtH family NRPS accessory protein [Streptomyces sp. NBC_01537]|uniref:MbtH family protein n=1 Tax=Streptomyces sp. NBC_01537 TaxID=2903896 RepID=UPI00386CD276
MSEKTTTTAPPRQYAVVVNNERQHSIWPAEQEVPLGWATVGRPGDEAECLAYIEAHWTDLRPLSARRTEAAGVTDG